MIRSRASRTAFWLFLLLVVLGAGWAAHQQWGWPSLALFDRDSESDRQDSIAHAPEEQPFAEPAEVEEPPVETAAAPAAEPSTSEPAAGETEATPIETASAPPEQELARESVAREQDTAPPAEPAPSADAAPAAEPATSDIASATPPPAEAEVAARTPAEAEAEVAAMAPAETATAAPQAESEPAETATAALRGEAAPAPGQAEASGASPETSAQGPARDLPAESEAPSEAVATLTAPAGDQPSGPEAETEGEPETGPSFDLVRVGRDGRAVIAGRAAPGAEVEVRSGDQVIDRVQATRRGEWVAIPARPLAPGDQELTAVASRPGAAPVESDQAVVVAVPDPTRPMPPAAAPPNATAQPLAVLVPREGKGAGRILQAPGRLSAEGTLALMTVSYDEDGQVLLSGEAPPGVPVRIYVDNRPVATVVGDAKGAWAAGLDEALGPGTYTLRLDQLGADGQTVARIETPFTRASEPPVEGSLQVDYVVVQPGNSLWRIARRLSGKGLDYVHIYDANQAQIRDPDLIYPGQVFEIPAGLGSPG